MAQTDLSFVGQVPEVYDRFMVPMLFQPYAEDMAARVALLKPHAVLETAAGSGVVTRLVAPLLAPDARYVVTDLNPPMLERAKARQPQDARIEWLAADALDLPFEAASFDALCCQFGVMFFPDRVKGYREALRVLKPGAPFLFNAWDSLAHNDFAAAVWDAVMVYYPDNPPDFFPRVPHGYFDEGRIRADLASAGFGTVSVAVVAHKSPVAQARDAAVAYCQGTPLRMEIIKRDPVALATVTDFVEAALVERFGTGPIVGKIQALVVEACA
ncbi:MAG: methyltransferase domain-containing protein [Paracoccaceae bacterium]